MFGQRGEGAGIDGLFGLAVFVARLFVLVVIFQHEVAVGRVIEFVFVALRALIHGVEVVFACIAIGRQRKAHVVDRFGSAGDRNIARRQFERFVA